MAECTHGRKGRRPAHRRHGAGTVMIAASLLAAGPGPAGATPQHHSHTPAAAPSILSAPLAAAASTPLQLPASTGPALDEGMTGDDAPAGDEPVQRNPFAPSRRSVALVSAGAGTGMRFHANSASGKIPKLRLRGLVQGAHGSGITALLEIDTVGVFVAHKGDIIGLPNGGSDNVIKVNEITDLSVVVEIGSLGQLIIIR